MKARVAQLVAHRLAVVELKVQTLPRANHFEQILLVIIPKWVMFPWAGDHTNLCIRRKTALTFTYQNMPKNEPILILGNILNL